MKLLYIIAFLSLSISIYAQESKKAPEQEDQTKILRQAKESEAKRQKEAQYMAEKYANQTSLVSEQGLETKSQHAKPSQASNNNSGKLLPNTASFEEMLATIPNRQTKNKASNSKNTNPPVKGLPNTATLEEIKKTIPKNE